MTRRRRGLAPGLVAAYFALMPFLLLAILIIVKGILA